MLCYLQLNAQHVITGTIVDEKNNPVVRATIQVKGTENGTYAGVDGRFSISALPTDTLIA